MNLVRRPKNKDDFCTLQPGIDFRGLHYRVAETKPGGYTMYYPKADKAEFEAMLIRQSWDKEVGDE